MRDLILVLFLFCAIYYSFKKPYLGVSAWIWVALTAPTVWVYGFSQHFRINLTIVLITIVSYIVVTKNKTFPFGSIGVFVLLFWLWTLLASIFNQVINVDDVWFNFNQFTKVLALYLFVTFTISKRIHVDTFIWAIVLAMSSYAAMEAVKFLMSGGGHKIVGRAGIIADRNDLAVAINMCIPFIAYLWNVTKHKKLKLGLVILIVLNVVSIIGTYSRGGFIGLSILGIAFWLQSNRKMLLLMFALMLLPVLYINAPADWKERQTTISTASSEDSSFIGRLWAWKVSTMIAIDNPITGGGFKAVTDPILWRVYGQLTPDFGPVYTKPMDINQRPKAAHNIYFQVLGDNGFIGLLIFLSLLFTAFFTNRKNLKLAKEHGEVWCEKLCSAISLSFVAYGITGLNVSLAYFELLYALMGIVLVIKFNMLYKGDADTLKLKNN